MKIIKSIVDESLKEKFSNADWANDLILFATYKCEIDGLLAAGNLFCPELIIIDDFVFIKRFWKYENEEESMKSLNILKTQFNNNKKEIEIFVNSCPIGELFLGKKSDEMDDEDILNQFCKRYYKS